MNRFWDKVDKSGECWEWTAAKTPSGYGVFSLNGKNIGAHRAAVIIDGREIPEGMYVCHSCDNKGCVNPHHLWVGSQSENVKDMYGKGRGRFTDLSRGENHWNAKLTREDVKSIRGCMGTFTKDSLARIFGVSAGAISSIWHRKNSWREPHVESVHRL